MLGVNFNLKRSPASSEGKKSSEKIFEGWTSGWTRHTNNAFSLFINVLTQLLKANRSFDLDFWFIQLAVLAGFPWYAVALGSKKPQSVKGKTRALERSVPC